MLGTDPESFLSDLESNRPMRFGREALYAMARLLSILVCVVQALPSCYIRIG